MTEEQQNLSGLFTEKPTKAIVYADYREQASGIIELLPSFDIEVKLFQLPVADFLVSDKAAIERKTGDDFITSMLDGRLFEQAERLADSFEKPLVILEGEVFGIRQVNDTAIKGAMLSLALDFGVPILQTKTMSETVALIALLAKREQLDRNRSVRLQGMKKQSGLAHQQQFIVESLPAVGPNTAKALLKKFKSVEKVFKASEKQLKTVDKIGDKKAKAIRKLLSAEYGAQP